MSYVDALIARLGGTRKTAEITGYPVSTVNSWKVAGCIHDRHKPVIMARAAEHGIKLEPADFFPSDQDVAA